MPDESRAVCRRWHTAVMGHQGRATAGVALGTWGGTEGRATAGAVLGAGGGAPRAGQRLEPPLGLGGTEGRAAAGVALGVRRHRGPGSGWSGTRGGEAPRAGQRLERLSGWEVGHRGAGQRLERRLGH